MRQGISFNEQPGDTSASAFVSRGLFGDGACAAVVRGDDRAAGLRILSTGQYLVPGTIPHMQYQVDEQGNHFETKREVVPGLKRGFPAVQTFLARAGYHPCDLAFLISHTGGPKVMDAVITELDVEECLIAASRESLREVGNLSSATIFDVLYRTFEPIARPMGPEVSSLASGLARRSRWRWCSGRRTDERPVVARSGLGDGAGGCRRVAGNALGLQNPRDGSGFL